MSLLQFRSIRRMTAIGHLAFVIAVASGGVAAFALADDDASDAELLQQARTIFQPLPKDMGTPQFPVTPERVRLGHMLFFDPRISTDGTGSCLRCHQPALYGADGLAGSIALHDKRLPRNAPTVFNAALNASQHWDGGFANVEAQAKGALLGPGFGNADHAAAMARVKAIPGYDALFQQAFPGEANPVSADNWGKAIGAYERTLVSPSRFDDYLRGKSDALSAPERKGLRTFIETGCVDCHRGPGLGGLGFRKFGVVSEYWKATGSTEIDKGRFGVTSDPADMYKFKVAGLRNVAMTPPYFHDGSVAGLPQAVRVMAKVQLDADLADTEADAIVTFLGSLTGSVPEGFGRAPVLPTGGFRSPVSPSSPGAPKR
jgi:cytochrome c peroxidase